jgi:hypothetical protein
VIERPLTVFWSEGAGSSTGGITEAEGPSSIV